MKTAKIINSEAHIKSYLKQKYGIDARVNYQSRGGKYELSIHYELGIDPEPIANEFKRLQYGHMCTVKSTEAQLRKNEKGIQLGGVSIEPFRYVFISRSIRHLYFEMARLVSKTYKIKGTAKLRTEDDMRTYFRVLYRDAFTWDDLIYVNLSKTNFQTQDINKLKFVACKWDHNHKIGGLHFIYEVDEVRYDTNNYIFP